MIESFTVGAIFKVIDQASPALVKILRQVRELRLEVDKARESLASISKVPGIGVAIGEADKLATSWANVTKEAQGARLAIASASRAAALPPSLPGGGGGGRGRTPSWPGRHGGGGGGMHVGGPGVGMPGGGHLSFSGGAMAAVGAAGYAMVEAAQMEDAVWQLIYHSGLENNDANKAKFRKILQDATASSGYGLKDIAESAKQEIRMFQGTPGGGIDILPEMLRAATIESRLKGSSPEESMKSLIGLAHMTKQYSPEAIKKLAPAFAFLSTANPGSLGSIERPAMPCRCCSQVSRSTRCSLCCSAQR
jgi:hypothetical protein